MKFTKNIALSLLLLIAGLQAAAGGIQQNNSTIVAPQEKSIALQMIEAMQGCIFFNKSIQNQLIALNTMKYLTGKPVLVLGDKAKLDQVEKQNIEAIKEQNTIFSEATALYHKYINELRQTYNKIKRPALTNLPKMQESTNLIELHFIELTKFNKTEDQLESQTDKWIFFLKNAHKLSDIPNSCKDSQVITEAFHIMEYHNWNDERRNQYEIELLNFKKDLTHDHALLEEGRQEEKETVAINALKKGLDLTVIIAITGLKAQQIEALRKKL